MGKNKHKKHHKHDSLDCSSTEVRGQGFKLILKVGGSNSTSINNSVSNASLSSSSSDKHTEKHRKKKKKKEKKKEKEKRHHRHHKQRSKEIEEGGGGGEEEEEENPPKRRKTEEILSENNDDDDDDNRVEEAPDEQKEEGEEVEGAAEEQQQQQEQEQQQQQQQEQEQQQQQEQPLQRLLTYILPLLEKRDSNRFFALPVSDKFAPGYSTVIKEPMDFSTMKSKLKSGKYSSLEEFKRDFELMCENAMTYNQRDTVYYKAAKKLLILGQRVLTPERLRPLRTHFDFMKELTVKELGFELFNDDDVGFHSVEDGDQQQQQPLLLLNQQQQQQQRHLSRFEAIPDDLTPQEIVQQAQKAAEMAASKLTINDGDSKVCRKNHLGFLRQNPEDGTTTLTFLTGGDGITDNERPVLLGSLIGKVKQGTGSLQNWFSHDHHHHHTTKGQAKAVYPLYYGAFSSHGPTYDSTFANLTKEETELVYSTYGDEVGVKYAESIVNFGRNCDYAMFIVDHLLDILTGNEHRSTSKYVQEQKMIRTEEEIIKGTLADQVDFEALKSLDKDGIDVSFLESLKVEYEKCNPSVELLNENAELINELKETQHERLSSAPPQHYGQMPKPNEKEEALAERIRTNLAEMAKNVAPGQVVPENGIKKLLGLPPITN